MRIESVMLFAAGFGTRMGALTRERPKPLIEVGGRALIDHALDLVRAAGVGRIVVNAHYRAGQIIDHFRDSDVTVTVEAPDILDTGGGLRAALPLTGAGPLFTMNTDAVWDGPNPLDLLARAWRPGEMGALLLCAPPARAIGHDGAGDFRVDDAGRATRGAGLVYTGVQILETGLLAEVEEEAFSLNQVWDRMIARGALHALPYPGRWCDVGHPGGIALAEDMLAGRDV
ncbi:nucleotidyltransferase family protein [Roseovarius spongiae]|uniref:Nucleotidyltransferase family protein n=1 Tax=Roseovarius spongiae TaxID=2320272 RepID=A0A3A8AVL2_9RHOB|nr:nucleotidyltransferase family protein [Roseovarius spongiae]RKF13392.1 nucleotidyltransferase family protein [Roseovarius spongiae]